MMRDNIGVKLTDTTSTTIIDRHHPYQYIIIMIVCEAAEPQVIILPILVVLVDAC